MNIKSNYSNKMIVGAGVNIDLALAIPYWCEEINCVLLEITGNNFSTYSIAVKYDISDNTTTRTIKSGGAAGYATTNSTITEKNYLNINITGHAVNGSTVNVMICFKGQI